MIIDQEEIPVGLQRYVDVDFAVAALRLGTTVSSAAWSVVSGTAASISGTPTLASGIAQALIATHATTTGDTIIKCTATMADTQTDSKYFKIVTINPGA